MSKSAHSSLGLKQIRVVIDGGTTAENQAKIIAIVKKHDPKAKVEFYKATGKIVGVMAKAKMDGIKRDLKQIDDKISAKEKLQSLKEAVDMTELEQELKRLKKANPGKKVTYFFTKDNPKGYKITIKEGYDESVNEGSTYNILRKFLETTLRDENKGYYWIFTNNVLDGNTHKNTLVGHINDEGGHGKYSKSEVEDDLKRDEVTVNRKLKLLKQAIDEFNKENKTNLKFTYKLNNPIIKPGNSGGFKVYDADNLIANVTIK